VARLKQLGDLAQLEVACDLIRRGHRVAFPYGEDVDFDLVLCRGRILERVQVKHARSRGGVVAVKCRSHSLTGGRVRRTKHYTPPAAELGGGRSELHLRLVPPRNGQRAGIRWADDYADLGPPPTICPTGP
jgi:PD-(D/E)XK nuclease superfamily protein